MNPRPVAQEARLYVREALQCQVERDLGCYGSQTTLEAGNLYSSLLSRNIGFTLC